MPAAPRFHVIAPLALAATMPLLAGCNAETPAPRSADILITNVHVIDVTAGSVSEDRVVAIAGGRITGVWPTAEAPPVEAGQTLAGEGRWLMPGLFDAHVHFRGGADLADANRALLPLYLANGVTSVRDAGGDLTPDLLAWRAAIDRGELAGPRIYTSGPKLDGPDPAWDGSLALAGPDDVPAALDSLAALGADYVKIYDGSVSAETYLAIVREAEARGLAVSGHMPLSLRFLDAVEAGLDATEHLYYAFKAGSPSEDVIAARVAAGELGFWSALWELMDTHDEDRAADVYEAMARHGTAVVPTLHIGAVLAQVEHTDHSGDAELLYIDPAVEATYSGRVASARGSPAEVRERTRLLRDLMAGMVAPMHEAGVTFLAGSDAGPFNSYVYPGFSLHAELEALVAAGLSPAAALAAATVNPAVWLGVDDEQGRVAVGQRADLVLLARDPLADIGATREIEYVIVRGSDVLSRDDLDALLAGVSR